MLNIQLFVEGQEVDLFKDESVTLTQTLQDVRDIEKVFTDFSRTFSVPASKENNKIFKHFYNPSIIGFDSRYKKDAEIHLNYRLFKKGRIKLEGSTTKNNRPHTYKLTFFGRAVNLKDLLGEDKLENLNFLHTHFSFTYTSANVLSYMEDGLDITAGATTYTDAIIFPLITHSKRLIYDSNHTDNNVNTATLNNLAYIADNRYGLEIGQLKPALRVYAIIKAIENQYSNIRFSDDFFNTDNEDFYNLYLWLHNKTGGMFVDEVDTVFAKEFILLQNDNNDISLSTDSFSFGNINRDRYFDVFINPPSVDEFNFVLYKDGQPFKRYDGLTTNYTESGQDVWRLSKQENGYLNLGNDGGTFTYAIESEVSGTFRIKGEVKVERGFLSSTTFTNWTSTATKDTNTEVVITRQMPDIKVLDFLTGLFKMFNLTAFENDNGVIEVKTLDSFYAGSTKIWDITEFVDNQEKGSESILPYRQVDLTFEGLDNFFANNHKELFKIQWGELKYSAGSKFEGDTYEIKLPFEHFKYERLHDVNGNTLTPIQWGWSADSKQDPTLGEPLLFYPIKQTLDIGVKNLEDVISQKTTAYIPSNSLELTDSFNLNFNTEFNEYALSPFETNLFSKYYKNYIVELFDKQRRLVSLNAYLPLSIITNLSLADNIRVFNTEYRINKITTNFETLQSNFELINTTVNAGDFIEVDPIIPWEFNVNGHCITADTIVFSADNTSIRADFDCDTDGVSYTSTAKLIPLDLDAGHQINVNFIDAVVPVTAPTLEDVTQETSTTTTVYLSHKITDLGKIADVKQIAEYGFLWSTDSSALDGSDIDTLKLSASVNVVSIKTNELNKYVNPQTVKYNVGSLSSGTDIYWRFYARTSDGLTYNRADAITEEKTSTTL